jgi:heptosyltransferase-2/heptosyltransferase-3
LSEAGAASAATRALQPVVIQFGRFGDMVMLSSVLQLLHQRFGRPCVVLGAGPWNRQLFLNHPDVARVWSFTRHVSMALGFTWWRAVWTLRRSAPGPVYVCERQLRQVKRIRRLLAFSGIDPARCLYITDERAAEGEHWVDRLVGFARRTPPALSEGSYPLPPEACRPAPRLQVVASERAELRTWLQGHGWEGRTLVLIQPGNFRSMSRGRDRWQGARVDDKAWPLADWVSLLRKIGARLPGALLVLCGAPQEGPMLEQIRLASSLPQVVVAELPMRRLLALCELAHSMISVDTGPAHAAAALGLPLLVLYGAESPRQWLPRSPSGSPVVALGGPPRLTRVDQITVEEVFEQWRALSQQPRTGAAPPTLS